MRCMNPQMVGPCGFSTLVNKTDQELEAINGYLKIQDESVGAAVTSGNDPKIQSKTMGFFLPV